MFGALRFREKARNLIRSKKSLNKITYIKVLDHYIIVRVTFNVAPLFCEGKDPTEYARMFIDSGRFVALLNLK